MVNDLKQRCIENKNSIVNEEPEEAPRNELNKSLAAFSYNSIASLVKEHSHDRIFKILQTDQQLQNDVHFN